MRLLLGKWNAAKGTQGMNADNLTNEFAQILSCTRCTTVTCKNILRNSQENVPQPGFVGVRFPKMRVLLAGRNPGHGIGSKAIADQQYAAADQQYIAALRRVRDEVTVESFEHLREILRDFIPKTDFYGNYSPLLRESGLELDDIAYCNVVRCRTAGNAQPSAPMASQCTKAHFGHWLDLLRPRVVVFIGKWAWKQGEPFARVRQIPCDFLNRLRSLSSDARKENRRQVAKLVRDYAGQ